MAAVLVLLMAVLVSGDVTCPDGGTCPDGETCCEQESGHSCCAYPNAVCCPGQTHCCPEGFSCNAHNDSCDRVDKVPGTEVQLKDPNPDIGQYCKDGSFCYVGTVCCLIDGRWSCCYSAFAAMKSLQPRLATGAQVLPRPPPYLCPNGRICNFGSECCFSDQGWSCCLPHVPYGVQEKPDFVSLPKVSDEQIYEYCPDGSTCPPGKKCCMTQCGWTCCIATLSLLQASPERRNASVSIPARPVKPSVSVVTCDKQRSCLSGQTCCKHPRGTFSCCPFPKGECCRHGHTCCNRATGWSCGSKNSCVWSGILIPPQPQPKE